MKEVNKILFITLSNIGDVILTLPVFDRLRADFPGALITVLTGPRPSEIFQGNSNVSRVIVYQKRAGLIEKAGLFKKLKKENFDLVVDMRNSLLNVLLPSRRKVSPFLRIPGYIVHMKDRHLYKAKSLKLKGKSENTSDAPRAALDIKPEDKEYIENILRLNLISDADRMIVVSPGARSHTKMWPKEKFLELSGFLIKDLGVKIVLAGDKDDALISGYMIKNSGYPLIDLCGKTSLKQLAYLLQKTCLLITNDSANLHMAGYLGVPAVAIFGPTNELKYGPWSPGSRVVKKDLSCRPCQKAQCGSGDLKCLEAVKVEDVMRQVREVLDTNTPAHQVTGKEYKRILIARTDRIGDVVLSTPAIRALRIRYPGAYIAMMTSPYAKDVVIGNPDLDEIIVLDKDDLHRGIKGAWNLARELRKRRFDLAVAFHPANRVHLIFFLAGIPRRIGYDRKMGFLLTDKIRHLKQLGQKHELEYNFDLLKILGIELENKGLLFPIRKASEKWIDELFAREGIKQNDRILAINPGASCRSKIWPPEWFARVADQLIDKYGLRVFVVAGPKDKNIADNVVERMKHKAVNLAEDTSISQLASLLKRSSLFISNDSGPVHIASAVATPVISIFGRSQKGLGPKRWGPVGGRDVFLHKDVGCVECLAHNCDKGFLCLKAITVDDVVRAADQILANSTP